MCSAADDPTTYDAPRPTCQRLIWSRGEDRRCGQSVGVTRWTDYTGREHVACPNHVQGMKRRWPEDLPERAASHGTLGLSSPWARGAFGPADVIEIENRIPPGFTIGVSGHRTRALVWVIDPEGHEITRWVNQHDAVYAAKRAAEFCREAVAA